MTPNEQLELWVDGHSVHNHDKWYEVVDADGKTVGREKQEGGECCPDFSCCNPNLLWDRELRIRFRDHPEHRDAMLLMSLASLTQNLDPAPYIAGTAIVS